MIMSLVVVIESGLVYDVFLFYDRFYNTPFIEDRNKEKVKEGKKGTSTNERSKAVSEDSLAL